MSVCYTRTLELGAFSPAETQLADAMWAHHGEAPVTPERNGERHIESGVRALGSVVVGDDPHPHVDTSAVESPAVEPVDVELAPTLELPRCEPEPPAAPERESVSGVLPPRRAAPVLTLPRVSCLLAAVAAYAGWLVLLDAL